ncbi:hypothetical protein ACR789_22450 [Sphingobacterium siyangense]|uniref:Uncharacterized protein n=2 Tax=Sphingobacterium TaxID=28453 RepID=A0ACD5BWG1_9SPHI|nr:hypothetical protein [Sphingobacterium multivorum]VXC33155.1 membrane hypothetical protein [Sphingobacterium multivorum]
MSRIRDLHDKTLSFLLAFTVPILSFINSLRFADRVWFKNVIWINCFFYGFSMEVLDPIYDPYRYYLHFKQYTNLHFHTLGELFLYLKNVEIDIDYYQTYTAIFIGQFTSNYHFYFAFLAGIYGYFYSRNLDMIFRSLFLNKRDLFTIIITIALIVVIGTTGMSGFRFWTAAHIYLYVILKYFLYRKNKLILFSIIPLIHIGFLIPIAIFFCYRYLLKPFQSGYVLTIMYAIIILSSILSIDSISKFILGSLSGFSGGAVKRVEIYSSDQVIRDLETRTITTIGLIFIWVRKLLTYTVFTYLILNISRLRKREAEFSLITFVFLFTASFSVLSVIPIFDRFLNISVFLGFFFVGIFSSQSNQQGKITQYLWLSLLCCLMGLDTLNIILQNRVFYSIDMLYAPVKLITDLF